MYQKLLNVKSELYAYFAWLVAITAMLGSLYYSLVLRLAPCELCWYQRIAMYPLAIIIFVGIILKDKKLFYYTVGINVIGFCIAFFHVLLSQGVLPQSFSQCFYGPSCTTNFDTIFGFFTIPLQSLTAFTLILLSTRFHYLAAKHQQSGSSTPIDL
ncbi:disulfide bond formation protein B [candidate division WWE3 bacterium]|uniref:Disulfide bond formation protein B n=1 Tax=candidate division WWE3 bacterium TaxID=2053526 RepID=A0A7X9DK40_UNCKA|nr:disulfide bond formation protein B [candidate division WWE3 bacterium]